MSPPPPPQVCCLSIKILILILPAAAAALLLSKPHLALPAVDEALANVLDANALDEVTDLNKHTAQHSVQEEVSTVQELQHKSWPFAALASAA
jgi:hypothetical protein